MTPRRSVRVVITGRVQGVGFRYSLAEAALREGVTGWCRNRPDGAVEAIFCGVAGAVAALEGWCRVGPPGARVETVSSEPTVLDEPLDRFEIRR